MLINDIYVSGLKGNAEMFKWHLADMTDAELLTRPVPGANHANWQIGHLVKAEASLLGVLGGKPPELPAGFVEKYDKKTAADDAAQFLTKEELLKLFELVRAASVAFAETVTEEQLLTPGPERMQKLFPTNAAILGMLSGHVLMHVGQIQVLRRKLGKPVLF
jgi:DinB superfamily